MQTKGVKLYPELAEGKNSIFEFRICPMLYAIFVSARPNLGEAGAVEIVADRGFLGRLGRFLAQFW